MPVHDWTRVEAGIFHHFHHGWIEEIQRVLNNGILPGEFYALAEQHAAGFGPDVLTLQGARDDENPPEPSHTLANGGAGVLLAPPKVQLTAETAMEFYRRKQNTITVRHVTGDRVVAMIEIVSPGNKSGRNAMRAFVEKSAELLDKRIHLLLIDVLPPGRRDPQGIHGAVWEEITGEEYVASADKPLTLASYETALTVRAYVVHFAVGDTLTDMPLFLEPREHVCVPLEATYQAAWAAVPRRWRTVIEGRGK
ncbi:MAG: DUF4058 family protein [Gemmataceae bacterium]|nr:DUF4058 family protein [Gemmataceae bacterium]